jgi:hypothetical protein
VVVTLSDTCGECGGPIDVTRRVYRGPNGLPRCSICQVLAECRLEIVKLTTLAEMLEKAEGKGTLH